MILLTGAAGKTGKAVLRQFSENNLSVRAMVFRPAQIPVVESLGAQEVIVGDLTDEEFVKLACKNIEAIYFICPNVHPDEFSSGKSIIDAAAVTGVEHFVYHSVLHPQIEAMLHHWQKMRVEEYLFSSGIPFTILQPAVYMQNILANWNQLITSGIYQIPYSTESRISYVDLEDVAQAGAVIFRDSGVLMGGSGHVGATYELVGTRGMSHSEIASILSIKLHRPIHVECIPVESWEKESRQSGMDDRRIYTLVKMFDYYDRYGMVGNTSILTMLLNRPPTSYEAFLDRTIIELRKN